VTAEVPHLQIYEMNAQSVLSPTTQLNQGSELKFEETGGELERKNVMMAT
jgi:hypothetical protein